MKVPAFLLIFCLLGLAIQAQNNYTQAIQQGDAALRKKQFKTAINKYFAAEAFDPSKKAEVQKKVNRAFDAIEALRQEAEQASRLAQDALAQVKVEQRRTESALDQANKLISAFYFYADRFALAFKENEFYFLDKNGDPVTKLGKWEKAEQFDRRGFAKVENNALSYLLDTLGNAYRVAYEIQDLGPEVQALDLFAKRLGQIPEKVFQQSQLEILLVENNWLKSLPKGIGLFPNLTTLDLSSNQLIDLPMELYKLPKLTYMDLRDNPLVKEETVRQRLIQFLPNCTIHGISDAEISSTFAREKQFSQASYYLRKALESDSSNYKDWYNLSWYALFTDNPENAIKFALKTLELNPEAQRVETNLALGYLLSDQWPKANSIYLKWKGKRFHDQIRLCDDIFLHDITDLEDAGITHPDFEKVKKLFEK